MSRAQLTTAADATAFALAGNATLTLVSKASGNRFTFRIQAPMKDDRRDLDAEVRFVSLLSGPDNETDYRYIGFIRRGVYFGGGAKAKVHPGAPGPVAFKWAWERFAKGDLPAQLEVWHEGRCARCGRKLTVPSSIASGFGPECSSKAGFIAEALDDAEDWRSGREA